VLGRKQRNQRDAGGMRQAIDRRFFLRVEPSVIGDESDVLALERREFLNFEDVEASLYAPRPAFSRRSFSRGRIRRRTERKEEQSKNKIKSRTSASPQAGLPNFCFLFPLPMIFWNAL